MPSNNFQHDLLIQAKLFVNRIVELANEKAPRHVRAGSRVESQEGEVKVQIVATSTKGDARAQEYGSGIHSQLKKKSPHQISVGGKILIKPKTKKLLAFHWQVANANPEQFIFGTDGKVLLPQVKHPGIQAANQGKGYLRPAIKQGRKELKDKLPPVLSAAIRKDLLQSFRKGA